MTAVTAQHPFRSFSPRQVDASREATPPRHSPTREAYECSECHNVYVHSYTVYTSITVTMCNAVTVGVSESRSAQTSTCKAFCAMDLCVFGWGQCDGDDARDRVAAPAGAADGAGRVETRVTPVARPHGAAAGDGGAAAKGAKR